MEATTMVVIVVIVVCVTVVIHHRMKLNEDKKDYLHDFEQSVIENTKAVNKMRENIVSLAKTIVEKK